MNINNDEVRGATAIQPTLQQQATKSTNAFVESLLAEPRKSKTRLDRLHQIEKCTKERERVAKKRERLKQQLRQLKDQLEEEETSIDE